MIYSLKSACACKPRLEYCISKLTIKFFTSLELSAAGYVHILAKT